MFIPEFACGVLATLMAEMALLIVYAMIKGGGEGWATVT